jgi:hypothetical protein
MKVCDKGRSRKYSFIDDYRVARWGNEKGVGASFRLVPVNLGSWRFLQVGSYKSRNWYSHPVVVDKLNLIFV